MTTRDGSWDFRVWIAGGVAAAGLASPASATVPVDLAAALLRQAYDGKSDDLLTAGLGHAGLRGLPPGFADPLKPTAGELRRRAIYTAYRGLVDTTDAGGFGRLHGPGADERIAGVEYLAAVRTPDGAGTTTVMLQIPASFDAAKPCLVVVASSGSRGVYGALPTAGAWGLRHGCAVATSDKGTGVGFFDLDSGTGYRIDGRGATSRLWSRELNHAAHPLRFESGELVLCDYDLDRRVEQVVVVDIETGQEYARVDTGSPVQSVLFPAPGFGRDFYLCSFTTVSRFSAD